MESFFFRYHPHPSDYKWKYDPPGMGGFSKSNPKIVLFYFLWMSSFVFVRNHISDPAFYCSNGKGTAVWSDSILSKKERDRIKYGCIPPHASQPPWASRADKKKQKRAGFSDWKTVYWFTENRKIREKSERAGGLWMTCLHREGRKKEEWTG